MKTESSAESTVNCDCESFARTEPVFWCHRHQCEKTDHWFQLCRCRPDYFELWERGTGPGQDHTRSLSKRRHPCIHLGPIFSQVDSHGNPCNCPGTWLRRCEIHAVCSIAPSNQEGTYDCQNCSEYKPDVVEIATRPRAAEKLLLTSDLSPGDIVMLTAAVRELHRQYPGRFITDVRTPCPAIWKYNPFLTQLRDDEPDVRRIPMFYDSGAGQVRWADINRSNQHPVHFVNGYCEHLATVLGLPSLLPSEFKGDVYIGAEERGWYSQIEEITGHPTEFWIVNAGGKSDFTCKIWPREYFQEVVDQFCDRITFVQVGEAGHLHPPLKNVIDLRGKTDLRQLIRLVFHSSGILCGVSVLMHLAAAVERAGNNRSLRPCVVVGGGREPVHWEAYPGHQFLHTIGALPCCGLGGCWRSRVIPLGDGSPNDQSLCEFPEDGAPRCMRLITPQRVSSAIEIYLSGLNVTPCPLSLAGPE